MEPVYVVLRDGVEVTKPQGARGIYRSIGTAKGVVTSFSEPYARWEWQEQNPGKDYWTLTPAERDKLTRDYSEAHFAIHICVPGEKVWPK